MTTYHITNDLILILLCIGFLRDCSTIPIWSFDFSAHHQVIIHSPQPIKTISSLYRYFHGPPKFYYFLWFAEIIEGLSYHLGRSSLSKQAVTKLHESPCLATIVFCRLLNYANLSFLSAKSNDL